MTALNAATAPRRLEGDGEGHKGTIITPKIAFCLRGTRVAGEGGAPAQVTPVRERFLDLGTVKSNPGLYMVPVYR